MNQSIEVLFKLISVALDQEKKDVPLPDDISWHEVFDMSIKQGVVNIAYDGLQNLLNTNPDLQSFFSTPEMEVLRYKWIGYGMLAEKTYEAYVKNISELVSFYNKYEFNLILLKGYGLSLYYPNPVHRPVGDIDIVTIKNGGGYVQEQADDVVQRILNIPVTKSKIGHHSHFYFHDILVENHYELSNTYRGNLKQKKFEETLQLLCCKNLRKISLDGNDLFLPSSTFNAVFLMWHMASHFTNSQIILRQLCDWCQFIKAEKENIDWQLVNASYQIIGLDRFARIINNVIFDYLGIEECCSREAIKDKGLELRFIEDLLSSGEHKGLVRRMFRYPQYGWKYKLAFQSHWLPQFIKSLWLHVFHKEDIEEIELINSKY